MGFTKYTVEMASGRMIHIPSFMTIDIGIPRLSVRRIHIHACKHRRQDDLISLLSSFRIRKVS
jgi:hypothetical protein